MTLDRRGGHNRGVSVMSRLLPTIELSGPEGFEAFRDRLWHARLSIRAETPEPGEFATRWKSARWGGLEIARISAHRATPVECVRTPSAISHGDPDVYVLLVQVAGRTTVVQGDQVHVLDPGRMAVVDTTRPFSDIKSAGCVERLLVSFPRAALGLRADQVAARLAGRALPTGHGVGPLLVPLLAAMNDHAGGSPPVAEYAAGSALDLLSVFLADLLDTATGRDDALRRTLVLRAKAHIRAHLADPDLSPPTVAAACHVSVRHLQKLFAEQGLTVSGFIRGERLEQGRRWLETTGSSITEIAHQSGFRDSAHFSHAFKAAYGVSPRAHRLPDGRP
ncbi:MAG TPA: helix-turn-helix domain-containing protein [Thermomonospora sp.]|nr:helix-turn-helix domain-containing protein [Thermomonospora sp.]